MVTIEQTFKRLEKSRFRAGFHLDSKDREYVTAKGTDKIREHAEDFIKKRLAPAYIANDGRQTPMRGHPVFKAQHACTKRHRAYRRSAEAYSQYAYGVD